MQHQISRLRQNSTGYQYQWNDILSYSRWIPSSELITDNGDMDSVNTRMGSFIYNRKGWLKLEATIT